MSSASACLVATGILGFFYFAMLNTTMPAWIFLSIVLSFIANDLMYGPQAALIAECFTSRLRYTGMGGRPLAPKSIS